MYIMLRRTPSVGLVTSNDFTYLGAFRVPGTWAGGGQTFEFSNATLAYIPTGNSGAGSLMVAAHVSYGLVSELTIPTPAIEADSGDLPTASFIGTQYLNPAGISGPTAIQFFGMVYNPDDEKIYYNLSSDYIDAENPPAAIGRFTTSRDGNEGLWRLGSIHEMNHARNIGLIPSDWAAANGLTGRRLFNLRKRGSFNQGPNTHFFTPPTTLANGGTISAVTTVASYDEPTGSNWVSDWNDRNMYMGATWITTSDGRHALIATGIKNFHDATAPYPDGYYGYGNWVLPEECEPFGTCTGGRGHRAADPRLGWWMFNPAEYAAVVAGTKQLYEVDFYEFVQDLHSRLYRSFAPTYMVTGTDSELPRATFDYVNRRLFVTEAFGADSNGTQGVNPVIHVYQVS